MFRRKKRVPHPNPATEAELRKIADLHRQREGCHRQIRIYQDEIVSAGLMLDQASRKLIASPYAGQQAVTSDIADITAERVKRAEDGINGQRMQLDALSRSIDEEIARLSPDDLAYLDLED